MIRYKCDLSLQHLSTVAIAAAAWRTPKVTSEVKEFFKTHRNAYKKVRQELSHEDTSKIDWGLIENCVISQFNDINLSQYYRTNLNLVTLNLSVRLRQFLEDTAVKLISYGQFKRFQEDIEYYIENIHWTPFGTIDGGRIFVERFHDDAIEKDYFMWYEACIYCQESCIRQLWREMPNNLKSKTSHKINWFIETEYIMVACWQQCIEGDLPAFLRTLQHEKHFGLSNASVPDDMFRISVILGLPEAVKHYWQQLSPQQRCHNILVTFTLLCHNSLYYLSFHNRFSHAYCDITAFIVAELTDEHIVQFMPGFNFRVILTLVKWPWQDLFLQTLNKIWDLLSDDVYQVLLEYLVSTMLKDERRERRENYRDLFIYAWNRLPICFKENIDFQKLNLFEGLAAIDVVLVQMILADPHVHLTVADLLSASEYQFDLLIKSGSYEEVDNCIQKLCVTEEERETWLSNIDIERICKFFVTGNNCEEVDKFLNWRFSGDLEKITHCREKLSFD